MTGNLTVPNLITAGNVDGRDVSADGTKLDGIEAGATADQTAAEILTAIKTVDGTGSGLDADLLDGKHATDFATAAQGALANTSIQPTYTQAKTTWEAGTGTTESLVSPAKVAAAITAQLRVTTVQVLAATAGASVGGVGTYSFLAMTAGNTTINLGSTYAGSSLKYGGANTINNGTYLASWFTGTFGAAGSPSGTWRAVGHNVAYPGANISPQTLFLRIA